MAMEHAKRGYAHFDANMFFDYGGESLCDAGRIRDAHIWCQRITRQALAKSTNVVVSNTFTLLREMEPFFLTTTVVHVVEATGK